MKSLISREGYKLFLTRNLFFVFKLDGPFKGIIHQFWIYNIFCASTIETLFYKKPILKKQLWLRIIEKTGCSKWIRVINIINIIMVLPRLGSLWAPYFLKHFQSEFFFRDGPIIKIVYLIKTQNNFIYSKLMNNPFKLGAQFSLYPSQPTLPPH